MTGLFCKSVFTGGRYAPAYFLWVQAAQTSPKKGGPWIDFGPCLGYT